MSKAKHPMHPMQPLVWDGKVIRFKENAIVRYLLDHGGIDLNQIAMLAATLPFSKDDQSQFAQLIGYSVSGFGDLSYARKKTVSEADTLAAAMSKKRRR